MSTLREVVEDPKQHGKLAKLKIAMADESLYSFFALPSNMPHILWTCDTTPGCKGLVTTTFDGELINHVNVHTKPCPQAVKTVLGKRKKKKLSEPITPSTSTPAQSVPGFSKKSVKMKEMLVELGSLSFSELSTGILESTDKPRKLMPIRKNARLPESIPKVYDDSLKPNMEYETIETLDSILARRCRMCGEKKANLTPMKNFDGSTLGLKAKLEWLLDEEVSDEDGMPLSLCQVCVKTLISVYQTYLAAMKAQRTLRSLLAEKARSYSNDSQAAVGVPKPIKEEFKILSNLPQKKKKRKQTLVPIKAENPPLVPYTFDCEYCPEKCFTKQKLNDHIFDTHIDDIIGDMSAVRETDNHDLACKLCKERPPSQMHVVKHYREVHNHYYCDLCKDRFQTKEEMHDHVQVCHNQEARSCDECGELFRSIQSLDTHREYFHSNKPQYSCKVCNRLYVHKRKLLDHIALHAGKRNISCDKCGKKYMSMGSLRNHLDTHKERVHPLQCEHCSKTFWVKKYLIVHMKRYHLTTWYYRCLDCGAERSSMDDVAKHCATHGKSVEVMRLSHATCEHCGSMFPTQLLLARHVSKTHENPNSKPRGRPPAPKTTPKRKNDPIYECLVCQKMVGSKAALKMHMACAHETKKFKCTLCDDATFTFEALLRQHEKNKHNIVHDYRCAICGNAYDSHRKLSKHIDNTHSRQQGDFQCGTCDKRFRLKSTLEKHERTHVPPEEVPIEVPVEIHEVDEPQQCDNKSLVLGGVDDLNFVDENVIRITLLGLEGVESTFEVINAAHSIQ